MLLDISRDVSTNIKNAKGFSVTENSAKLFAMLGTMLYKDKERSCLTELSSNALDAHAMVGKHNEPIQITMPTMLAQEITIRDLGPGLSEDNVYKFLTTYGESSKQNDVSAIGGYGIGAKSPASVTDSWTIHSHHNGTHTQYLVFVSADGVPALKKIISKPTTESGLAIVIPVKSDRIQAWKNAAQVTYEAYPITPVIHNFGGVLRKRTWIHENDIFNTSGDQKMNVFVDHRIYEVDRSKIYEGVTNPIINLMCRVPDITLKFTSSEINKSLSREELQFDKKTITSIQNKLVESHTKLKTMWADVVPAIATNELQYLVLGTNFLDKIFKNTQYSSEAMKALYNNLGNGDTFYSTNLVYGTRSIQMKFKGDIVPKFFSEYTTGIRLYKNSATDFFNYSHNSRIDEATLNLTMSNIGKVVFLQDDGVSMLNMRVKAKYSGKSHVIIAKTFDFLPEFLKPQIVLASTLDKPVIVRAKRGSVVKTDFYVIGGRSFVKAMESDFDKTKKIAYVRFTKATTTSSILPDFENYISTLTRYGVQVVGIKETTDAPTWAKHPKDVINEIYDDKCKNFDNIFKAMFVNDVKNNPIIGNLIINNKRTPNDSYWNEVVDMVEDIRNSKNPMLMWSSTGLDVEVDRITALSKSLSLQLPTIHKHSLSAIIDKLKAHYPMLGFVISSYENLTNQKNADILIEYVSSVGI